jgi:transcriptional regulator with XRE-family HTH domain
VNRTFVAKLELAQTSPSLSTLFRVADGLQAEPGEFVAAVARRLRKERAAAQRQRAG